MKKPTRIHHIPTVVPGNIPGAFKARCGIRTTIDIEITDKEEAATCKNCIRVIRSAKARVPAKRITTGRKHGHENSSNDGPRVPDRNPK